MNNNDLIFSGWESDSINEALTNVELAKLVREINFTYKLKVFDVGRYSANTPKLAMCNEQGLPVCFLWVRNNDRSELEYCYASPYYHKARGRTTDSRETVFSTKLASLMTTLKRNNCVPSNETLMIPFNRKFEDMIRWVKNSICKNSKSTYGFGAEELHTLLKIVFEREPMSAIGKHDTSKLRKILEEFDTIDTNKKEMRETVTRDYNKGFYAIGVFHNGDYVVSQVKRSIVQVGSDKQVRYEYVKPFKRVKELAGETELIPALTMMKVSLERKNGLEYRGRDIKFPESSDFYDADVGIVFSSPSGRGLSNYSLALIPCSLL